MLKTELYDYQKKALDQALYELSERKYFALLMEMGTGKTLTTLAIYESMGALPHNYWNGKMVVIAPKALIRTWQKQVAEHTDETNIFVYNPAKMKSTKEKRAFNLFKLEKHGILLVNIEIFSRYIPDIMDIFIHSLAVIDESSKIKNKSERTKNLLSIAPKAAMRMILTGTEVSNSPLDVFYQFEFLSPGIFGQRSFFMFRAKYAIMEKQYISGRSFDVVVGYRNVEEVQFVVNSHSFRALKKDCLSLPEKIVSPIYVDPTAEQRKIMKELKDDCITLIESSPMTILNKAALFSKFRQIVGGTVINEEASVRLRENPKLDALIEDLEAFDGQAIIWASFDEECRILKEELERLGKVSLFCGENVKTRDEELDAFVSGESRFLVGNPESGAYGLNLQNCSIMYYFSRPLSPTTNWQSMDRIHRVGQKNVCIYKPIIMTGTVDERIEELLELKTNILDAFQHSDFEFINAISVR